jgi:hypothetical protein
MKTLKEFAQKNNLELIPINYTFQGIRLKRKGFDLVRKETFKDITGKELRHVVLSFEPKNYSVSTDKWYLRACSSEYKGQRYFTRITPKVLNSLPLENSFFVI